MSPAEHIESLPVDYSWRGVDYGRLTRKYLLAEVAQISNQNVLLFDEFGDLPSSETATVEMTPIAEINLSLSNYLSDRLPRISPDTATAPKGIPTEWIIHNVPHHDLESRFSALASQWKRDTLHLSRIEDIIEHPAYQQIIEMGWPVVPLILRELENERRHWFIALARITHQNPLAKKRHSTTKEMASAWIEWGKKHGQKARSVART
jgi:hypothetical protein